MVRRQSLYGIIGFGPLSFGVYRTGEPLRKGCTPRAEKEGGRPSGCFAVALTSATSVVARVLFCRGICIHCPPDTRVLRGIIKIPATGIRSERRNILAAHVPREIALVVEIILCCRFDVFLLLARCTYIYACS